MRENHEKEALFGVHMSEGPAETMALGQRIAQLLLPGGVVLLYGRPGAGKTQMAKGICNGLGYDGMVTSPTFALINVYEGIRPIYHVDLYRLGEGDVADIGLLDILEDGESVVIIEWPELATPYIEQAICVDLEPREGDARHITIGKWRAGIC
ncbi:tRNA (adenosine(37)-N6)-threonylcarbamoyltransferase complex ATPase subunit type 1 TsaE [Eubacteriales bacterium OttesenSCG-928-M02]|nr:tRNA (adenosine(37)-N6)-threonylcarbamoyltransferase complex ATPase subunit type 1 TsaE [Eubacteriales bacterium OttesenSCG-928-M02]